MFSVVILSASSCFIDSLSLCFKKSFCSSQQVLKLLRVLQTKVLPQLVPAQSAGFELLEFYNEISRSGSFVPEYICIAC